MSGAGQAICSEAALAQGVPDDTLTNVQGAERGTWDEPCKMQSVSTDDKVSGLHPDSQGEIRPMAAVSAKRSCMYCGEPTKKGKRGEHVVPESIGGALTLNDGSGRVVCGACNSGVLSQLDRELCSRSYLSIIASQQIDAHLWQAWDVDHVDNHQLVEARPSWADDEMLSSLTCFPQVTFARATPDVRGDSEEAMRFGQEHFAKVLFKAIRQCFEKYCAGVKGVLHFERIRSGLIHDGYRLSPRIFTRHSIGELARNIDNQSFTLRFVSEEDKRFALWSLSRIGDGPRINGWSHKPGSNYPTICCFFDIGETLRALMKIGLNLVATCCRNTPVDSRSFKNATRIIRDGGIQIPRKVLAANGFVRAEDVQSIKADNNGHSFRIMHLDGVWNIYSCFFGGRIGTHVRLPGPNHEKWVCADIVAPIGSKDWSFRTSSLLQPLNTHVVWNDSRAISPSLKLLNSVSSITVEMVKKRPAMKQKCLK